MEANDNARISNLELAVADLDKQLKQTQVLVGTQTEKLSELTNLHAASLDKVSELSGKLDAMASSIAKLTGAYRYLDKVTKPSQRRPRAANYSRQKR